MVAARTAAEPTEVAAADELHAPNPNPPAPAAAVVVATAAAPVEVVKKSVFKRVAEAVGNLEYLAKFKECTVEVMKVNRTRAPT